jgi:pimeloyl-ACP methyl ester carboxylesterase
VDSYRRGDLRFDVDDDGPAEGEPVVLLHGFPQSASSWSRVTPRLVAAGLRVLAPDQRGYSPGARPRGRGAYRLGTLAEDIVVLLDAAGVRRAHVVGHDWGGTVAWALGMWHADRVASLTALSTPHPAALLRALVTSDQLLRSWHMAAFALPALPERLFALSTAAGRDRLVRALVNSGQAADRAREDVDRLAAPGALTGALNWYRAMPLNSPRALRRVTVPTLYVWSTGDRFLGRAAAESTAGWVDGPYRLEALPEANHWLPDRHAEAVADLVTAHVRDHPAR